MEVRPFRKAESALHMSSGSGDFLQQLDRMIPLLQQKEKMTQDERKALQGLLDSQDFLIKQQRELLLAVSQTSSELLELEKQRKALQNQLASQRTKLLINSAEISRTSAEINAVCAEQEPREISQSPAGTETLKIIETAQQAIYDLTHQCVQNESMTAPPEAVGNVISLLNDAYESALKAGIIEEDPEDTIRRQSIMISTLVPEE